MAGAVGGHGRHVVLLDWIAAWPGTVPANPSDPWPDTLPAYERPVVARR